MTNTVSIGVEIRVKVDGCVPVKGFVLNIFCLKQAMCSLARLPNFPSGLIPWLNFD